MVPATHTWDPQNIWTGKISLSTMFCEIVKTSNTLPYCRIFTTKIAEVGSAGSKQTPLIPGGRSLHASQC